MTKRKRTSAAGMSVKKAAIGAGRYVLKNAVYNGLNAAVPGAGFAVQGLTYAGKKAFAASRKLREDHKKLLRLRGGSTGPIKKATTATGVYVGKFKRPRKRFGGKTEGTSLKKGFEVIDEVWGAVNDPHCIYVTHSTQHLDNIVDAITGALLRKLFQKAGIPVNNTEQEMPLQYYNNSAGMSVVFQTRTSTQSVMPNPPTMDYAIPNGTTFNALLGAVTAMKDYMKGFLNNNSDAYTPYMLSLYCYDYHGVASTDYRLLSQMNLENETVHLDLTSTLMVQNRTQGQAASAGDLSSDRVDNQPVSGWLYEFKHGTPRLRQSGATGTDVVASTNAQLAVVKTNGVRLVRSAEIDAEYADPPNPRVFGNIAKASKILLNPGQMKRITLRHKFVGKLPTLLAKLAAKCEYIADFWTLIPGRSQMVALSEALRTSSSNPIYLNYECRKRVGAYSVTKKNDYILPKEKNTEYNNLT